jgi:hypothetical protein
MSRNPAHKTSFCAAMSFSSTILARSTLPSSLRARSLHTLKRNSIARSNHSRFGIAVQIFERFWIWLWNLLWHFSVAKVTTFRRHQRPESSMIPGSQRENKFIMMPFFFNKGKSRTGSLHRSALSHLRKLRFDPELSLYKSIAEHGDIPAISCFWWLVSMLN